MKNKQDSRLKAQDSYGFTLLELIISFAILGVIFLIIGSGLRLGVRAWERGEEIVDETQRIRVLWERLSFEIRSAYPYMTDEVVDKRIAFEGKSDSLSFVTSAVEMDGKGGHKWVHYYVKDGVLMIKEKRLPDKEIDESKGKEIILEPKIKDIKFEYYEKKKENWEASWNSKEKGRLPEIIKITITPEIISGDKKNKRPLPPMLIAIPVAYSTEGV
jgi:prepilin-type N-terminal cleavage/methylation domain-containing protein